MKDFGALATLLLLLILIPGKPGELQGRQAAEQDTLQAYIEEGRALFAGFTRLDNNGPSCISCHQATDLQLPIGGGSYGLDLTPIYGQFGEQATRNFIMDSPFPVMNSAYAQHPVTDAEGERLLAYLRHVTENETAERQPFSAGTHLLLSGLGGMVLILVLITLLWRRRKRGSVNEAIYERQIQSV